jgi:Domain of unknown function (DUF4158)
LPADFLNVEQRASYGQFSGKPNDIQLARFFRLDEVDIDFINNRRGRANRLAMALLIGSVRFLGTWPHDLSAIPTNELCGDQDNPETAIDDTPMAIITDPWR